jgi:hypothetical protein
MTSLRTQVIHLAHANPNLRPHLLPLLKTASGGQHVLVRDLPPILQDALRELGYHKRDILVEPRTNYQVGDGGGDGRRSFTMAVDLVTGQTKLEKGSWGGANINSPHNQVDLDTSVYPLPRNGAVIKGSEGGGPTWATIYVHPDNILKVLPSGASEVEPTDKELVALQIVSGIKSGYRADSFQRNGLGPYSKENPILQGLAKKGWVKITATGVQITLEGKNLVNRHPANYSL